MSLWGRIQSILTKSVAEDFIDLTALVFLTLTTVTVALLPPFQETLLRQTVGFIFVLLAPGWAVVAATFPRTSRVINFDNVPEELPFSGQELREIVVGSTDSTGSAVQAEDETDTALSGVERLVLSLGVGVAVITIAGIVLNFTPWPIALTPVLATLGSITLFCTFIGAVRRSRVPNFDRFRVPLGPAWNEINGQWNRSDYILNVVLVLSALLLVGTLAFTLTAPAPDDQYTNFWVLTEDEDENLVAGNYTDALGDNADRELVVGVENNEAEDVLYVVVVQLQEVEWIEEEKQIVDQQDIDQFEQHIESESEHRWQRTPEVTSEQADNSLRIQYLLYKIEAPYTDTVPDEPTTENADYDLHLWID